MAYNTNNFKIQLKQIEQWLSDQYSGVHTGRATPLVLDNVSIESYGQRGPIKNIASIVVEDSKTLRVAPWDKSMTKEIENSIREADLGLSLVSDSDGVRVIFPMLTTENRVKLVKVLKEKLEEARIRIRKERTDEIDSVSDLPEDEAHRAKEEIQKNVDESNKNLEAIFSKKEVDVMN